MNFEQIVGEQISTTKWTTLPIQSISNINCMIRVRMNFTYDSYEYLILSSKKHIFTPIEIIIGDQYEGLGTFSNEERGKILLTEVYNFKYNSIVGSFMKCSNYYHWMYKHINLNVDLLSNISCYSMNDKLKECCICLEFTIRKLNECNHPLCLKCHLSMEKNSCPVCRSNIKCHSTNIYYESFNYLLQMNRCSKLTYNYIHQSKRYSINAISPTINDIKIDDINNEDEKKYHMNNSLFYDNQYIPFIITSISNISILCHVTKFKNDEIKFCMNQLVSYYFVELNIFHIHSNKMINYKILQQLIAVIQIPNEYIHVKHMYEIPYSIRIQLFLNMLRNCYYDYTIGSFQVTEPKHRKELQTNEFYNAWIEWENIQRSKKQKIELDLIELRCTNCHYPCQFKCIINNHSICIKCCALHYRCECPTCDDEFLTQFIDQHINFNDNNNNTIHESIMYETYENFYNQENSKINKLSKMDLITGLSNKKLIFNHTLKIWQNIQLKFIYI